MIHKALNPIDKRKSYMRCWSIICSFSLRCPRLSAFSASC